MEGSPEKRLYDAAAEGNTRSLQELLEKDKFVVDRVSFTCTNKSPLHVATMNGHFAFVQEILILNPRLAQQLDSQQSSPLHLASAEGYLEIVKKLLSAAPHMCLSRDCQGRNPLHLAAMKGHVEILKALIQEAPSVVWEKADRGQTVLHLCVKHRQLEALNILAPNLNLNPNLENRFYKLLEKDPKGDAKSLHELLEEDPNRLEKRLYDNRRDAKSLHELLEEDPKRLEKRLYDAAAEGNTESLQELLEKDEFLVDRVSFTSPNKTPLHVATMNGHLDFVEDLLYHNRDLARQLDSQQSSPLHIASAQGYLEIVEELLAAAPHMCMSRDCQGRTPLHHAVVREFSIYKPVIYLTVSQFRSTDPDLVYLEIVKKLLSAAPDMCLSRDCQGRNPLHLAAMKGDVEILKALIQEAPSAAREKADRDQTVLHLCVKHGQLEALKILVPNLNDRINAKDADGDTILHMAVALRRREKKGRIDAEDDAGDTFTAVVEDKQTEAAVEDKQIEIIRYLVENKEIDLNVKNSNGQTAIDILDEIQPPAVGYIKMRDMLRRVSRIDTKIRTQTQRVMNWLTQKGDTIMVVAVLIATVAFQAGVSPAGGIWQEGSTRAGEAIMAYTHPEAYKNIMRSNGIAFFSSVTTILLLISGLPFRRWLFMWMLIIIMWLTVASLTVSYAISVFVVSPKTLGISMLSVLKNGLGLWFAVMGIILIGSIVKWLEDLSKKKLLLKKLKKITTETKPEIENRTARQESDAARNVVFNCISISAS